jgi:hypothetical protein
MSKQPQPPTPESTRSQSYTTRHTKRQPPLAREGHQQSQPKPDKQTAHPQSTKGTQPRNQPTKPHTPPEDKTQNPADQPRRRGNWHRLNGTLLSSQGTDTHRTAAARPRHRGSRCTLLHPLLAVTSGDRLRHRVVGCPQRYGAGPRTVAGCFRGVARRDRPPHGVRSSLPGDVGRH